MSVPQQALGDPGGTSTVKLLLTVAEAATALGLCRSAVYELLLTGAIPSVKIGRARRIPLKGLEDFVTSHLITPNMTSAR
jgi:excisionase family DNA binding protein